MIFLRQNGDTFDIFVGASLIGAIIRRTDNNWIHVPDIPETPSRIQAEIDKVLLLLNS